MASAAQSSRCDSCLGQARQRRPGGLGQLRSLGPLLADGRSLQPHLLAGRGVAAHAAVAGVQDQQLQPRPRQVQQLAQLVGVDRVAAPAVVLQQQLTLLAVAGEMDDVPALPLLQRLPQGVAGGAVLQDPQLHRQVLGLVQVADQALQTVALAAEVERVGAAPAG